MIIERANPTPRPPMTLLAVGDDPAPSFPWAWIALAAVAVFVLGSSNSPKRRR